MYIIRKDVDIGNILFQRFFFTVDILSKSFFAVYAILIPV